MNKNNSDNDDIHKAVKQITVYINGRKFAPQKVVLNQKRWHHILTDITFKVNPYFGKAQKLYTSESGITVNSFTDLENHGSYVVSDHKKYQLIKGGYTEETQLPTIDYFEHYLTAQLARNNKAKKLAYVRRDLLVIYVFRNGRSCEEPNKFVLTNEDLLNWSSTLSFIALMVDMPDRCIRSLYNAVGSPICGPWELQHGASYVAVGFHERFKKKCYKIQEQTTEILKNGIPVIPRNKNFICKHHGSVKSWKQNLNWNHYCDECKDYQLRSQLNSKLKHSYEDDEETKSTLNTANVICDDNAPCTKDTCENIECPTKISEQKICEKCLPEVCEKGTCPASESPSLNASPKASQNETSTNSVNLCFLKYLNTILQSNIKNLEQKTAKQETPCTCFLGKENVKSSCKCAISWNNESPENEKVNEAENVDTTNHEDGDTSNHEDDDTSNLEDDDISIHEDDDTSNHEDEDTSNHSIKNEEANRSEGSSCCTKCKLIGRQFRTKIIRTSSFRTPSETTVSSTRSKKRFAKYRKRNSPSESTMASSKSRQTECYKNTCPYRSDDSSMSSSYKGKKKRRKKKNQFCNRQLCMSETSMSSDRSKWLKTKKSNIKSRQESTTSYVSSSSSAESRKRTSFEEKPRKVTKKQSVYKTQSASSIQSTQNKRKSSLKKNSTIHKKPSPHKKPASQTKSNEKSKHTSSPKSLENTRNTKQKHKHSSPQKSPHRSPQRSPQRSPHRSPQRSPTLSPKGSNRNLKDTKSNKTSKTRKKPSTSPRSPQSSSFTRNTRKVPSDNSTVSKQSNNKLTENTSTSSRSPQLSTTKNLKSNENDSNPLAHSTPHKHKSPSSTKKNESKEPKVHTIKISIKRPCGCNF